MAEEKTSPNIGVLAAIGGGLGIVASFITGDWAVWVPAGGVLGVVVGFAMDQFRK